MSAYQWELKLHYADGRTGVSPHRRLRDCQQALAKRRAERNAGTFGNWQFPEPPERYTIYKRGHEGTRQKPAYICASISGTVKEQGVF